MDEGRRTKTFLTCCADKAKPEAERLKRCEDKLRKP